MKDLENITMDAKPNKEVYPKDIQNKIYPLAKEIVGNIIKDNPDIYLANVFGSIARKDMGVYDRVYDNKRWGSDIDVVCIVDPNFKAPEQWSYRGSAKAFDVYDVDAIENYMPELGKKDLPIHPVKFLIYIPGKHDYDEAKQWSAIDIKDAKSKGLSVENLYINENELKRVMKK